MAYAPPYIEREYNTPPAEAKSVKEKVDLLITGGTLLVMDDAGTMFEDGGIAIRGDRIVAVGRSSKLRRSTQATRHSTPSGRPSCQD